MLDPENSVGRLRVIAEVLSAHRNRPVPDVLADALGAKIHTREFHRRVILLIDLAASARLQVDELSSDPSQELYAAAVERIANPLDSLDMREDWNKYGSAFDTRTLTLLETCERAIDARMTVKPPAEEQVKEVLAAVQDAVSSVLESDIEAEAQQLLLEVLRDVEAALLAYRISGLRGLRRALERSIGAVLMNERIVEKARPTETYKNVVRALGSAITLLRNIDFVRQLPEKTLEILKLMQ